MSVMKTRGIKRENTGPQGRAFDLQWLGQDGNVGGNGPQRRSRPMAQVNEWAGKGMNVNAIAPDYVATDNTESLRDDPERIAQILACIPAECWGAPEDFAGPVVFLASEAAAAHGEVLVVNGGWMGR